MEILQLRKHADRSGDEPEPGQSWPLAGISIVGDEPPRETTISTKLVRQARREGWLETIGENVVHRPGGPADDEWADTHTFIHLDAIVFHTLDGDVRYRVTKQPDKFVEGDDPAAPVTPEIYAEGNTRVDHFYELELED